MLEQPCGLLIAASSDSELKRNKAACIVIPITAQAAFVFSRPVCLLPHSNPYLPPARNLPISFRYNCN